MRYNIITIRKVDRHRPIEFRRLPICDSTSIRLLIIMINKIAAVVFKREIKTTSET